MTDKQIARRFGVCPSSVSVWIRLGCPPPPTTIRGRSKIRDWRDQDIARLRKFLKDRRKAMHGKASRAGGSVARREAVWLLRVAQKRGENLGAVLRGIVFSPSEIEVARSVIAKSAWPSIDHAAHFRRTVAEEFKVLMYDSQSTGAKLPL
jgi:hypothetical protein